MRRHNMLRDFLETLSAVEYVANSSNDAHGFLLLLTFQF